MTLAIFGFGQRAAAPAAAPVRRKLPPDTRRALPQVLPFRPCPTCGSDFRPKAYYVARGFGRFCSVACGRAPRAAAIVASTRARLLKALAVGGRAVCELAAASGLSRPAVSKHLAFFAAEGVVEARPLVLPETGRLRTTAQRNKLRSMGWWLVALEAER